VLEVILHLTEDLGRTVVVNETRVLAPIGWKLANDAGIEWQTVH